MSDPIWYPTQYCYRYGAQWCTAPYDGPPHYPDIPVIQVVDVFAPTVRFRRRRFWRKARDAAVAEWQKAGLILPVKERAVGYEAGTITLDCQDIPDVTLGGYGGFGMTPNQAEDPLPGAGWAIVERPYFEQLWPSRVIGGLKRIIVHEMGHAFGFGHGGNGVMEVPSTDTRINAEEIAALRAYFKL